ncbi:uncharacterized protein M6B38_326320 [Iris pallida]|uniref:Uncharacterized protein n=1 Tax=Iris pallida TaxID=29817 RepID=A0AAX6H7F4_IRIPA|nr:uncharacterized protein M6B38_326320 [Iris pallida]
MTLNFFFFDSPKEKMLFNKEHVLVRTVKKFDSPTN